MVLSEFYLVALSSLQVLGESCWTNAVTIEMFIFAIFELKIDFEQSQFRRIGVAFTQFYLFELSSLHILGESCFEAPFSIDMFTFAISVQKIDLEES